MAFRGASWAHALANAMELSVSIWNTTQSAVDSLIEAAAPAASRKNRATPNRATQTRHRKPGITNRAAQTK